MTADERFSLLVSVTGTDPILSFQDERIPADVPPGASFNRVLACESGGMVVR